MDSLFPSLLFQQVPIHRAIHQTKGELDTAARPVVLSISLAELFQTMASIQPILMHSKIVSQNTCLILGCEFSLLTGMGNVACRLL